MKIKISEVAKLNDRTLNNSHQFSALQYLDTGSITNGDIDGYQILKIGKDKIPGRAKRLVKDNTIVYSTVRPRLLHYGILKDPAENTVVSTGFVTIDADVNKIDPYYLYCHLIRPEVVAYLADIADTAVSSYPSINPDDIGDLEINIVEDISQQKKQTEIIKKINRKIQLNSKINAELESMAKTIYDYWFLQFDFPNEEGKPYRSSGGKMVWNTQLKREIPDGWKAMHLREIESNIITGKTPSTKKPEYYNGNIPFITIGDIRGNVFVSSTEITLSQLGADSQPNKYIPEDSICVTCIATPGLVGFASKLSQTNQQINTVICEKEYNKYYLYFSVKNHFEYSKGAKVGSTFANMNKGDFSSISILEPCEGIVQGYHKIVEPFFERIKKVTLENKELVKLRDWLLPMLMNGQVTVEERAARN